MISIFTPKISFSRFYISSLSVMSYMTLSPREEHLFQKIIHLWHFFLLCLCFRTHPTNITSQNMAGADAWAVPPPQIFLGGPSLPWSRGDSPLDLRPWDDALEELVPSVLRVLLLSTLKHGGALVEAITLNRRVVGSTPALAAMSGPWASPLLAVACALRRETPIQYPCCIRERLWVVVDLNGRNEWMNERYKWYGEIYHRMLVWLLSRCFILYCDFILAVLPQFPVCSLPSILYGTRGTQNYVRLLVSVNECECS